MKPPLSPSDQGSALARTYETRERFAFPAPGEVMSEIGFVLAVHLTIALVVVLTLDSLGLG